jgi:hypothetical protein
VQGTCKDAGQRRLFPSRHVLRKILLQPLKTEGSNPVGNLLSLVEAFYKQVLQLAHRVLLRRFSRKRREIGARRGGVDEPTAEKSA